jgi:hypothetical protein
MKYNTPTAIEFCSLTEGIEFIFNQTKPALLIVCSTREEWMHDLSADKIIDQDHDRPTTETPNRDRHDGHQLKFSNPTIRLIAKAQNVKIAFIQSLMHFRAYLSHLSHKECLVQFLAILNLQDLHTTTSEDSAQDISRSIALSVDTAVTHGLDLSFMFVRKRETSEDIREADQRILYQNVPILNSGTRSTGDNRIWSGRTIQLGTIFSKWCKVAKASQS